MMRFLCSFHWDEDDREDWEGEIEQVIPLGNHYELLLSSRSSTIRVLVGKCTVGLFACIPDYEADCMLSHLEDTFYNRERLMVAMDNPVDGTVVAYALKAAASVLTF